MDSNHHEIAPASPSSWCVYQFRHHRVNFVSDYISVKNGDTFNTITRVECQQVNGATFIFSALQEPAESVALLAVKSRPAQGQAGSASAAAERLPVSVVLP